MVIDCAVWVVESFRGMFEAERWRGVAMVVCFRLVSRVWKVTVDLLRYRIDVK